MTHDAGLTAEAFGIWNVPVPVFQYFTLLYTGVHVHCTLLYFGIVVVLVCVQLNHLQCLKNASNSNTLSAKP